MRKLKAMHELLEIEDNLLLSKKEKLRFSGDILQTMGALACLIAAWIYQTRYPSQNVVAGFIYLLGALIVGIPILITGIRGFLKKELTSAVELLVGIAMIISLLNNQFVVAILIPLLLTLVHFFEEKSVMSGRDALDGLKKMQTATAILLADGMETQTDAKALQTGDTIVVRPGMAFPIDGVVIKGSSSVNQQSLTGEAMPCTVRQGDNVYAGTLNLDGELTVTVLKPYRDTSFQKIVHLLEESEKDATAESRMVDRFMTYYIPLILIVATLVWLFTKQIDRAVAILVVSCPCGHMLISSAPTIASLSVALKHGVVIKSARFIETLSQVNAVFFDKTGTLTTGELRVESCIPFGNATLEEIYGTALSVARHSRHPLSKAIVAEQGKYDYNDAFTITEQSGMGVTGVHGNDTVILGNEQCLNTHGIFLRDKDRQSSTCSYVARNGVMLGVFLFSDTLRSDAIDVVRDLKNIGIQNVSMLTGDREEVARAFQRQCGLTEVFSQLLPEQKQKIVAMLKENAFIAFVGDGINDALALSAADVGIAMGVMGSDTAIQSADISLMNERLVNITLIFRLANKAREVIRQNIVLSFSTSLLMIALAATGVITALPGALLHNIGAFLVLFNSSRLVKAKLNQQSMKESAQSDTDPHQGKACE